MQPIDRKTDRKDRRIFRGSRSGKPTARKPRSKK